MSCKVQQSVCSDCVTYVKSRIKFNTFNTFNNVLDVLKKHQVKASFFVIGKNITQESAKVMIRAQNEGHDIENQG